MGLWKEYRIKKTEFWICVLGLQIMRLVRKGYTRFTIEDNGEEVIVKALRSRETGVKNA
jgi:hypothetical protein